MCERGRERQRERERGYLELVVLVLGLRALPLEQRHLLLDTRPKLTNVYGKASVST